MKERKEKLAIIAFCAIVVLCLLCFMVAMPYISKIIFTFVYTGWMRGVIFTMVFIILQFRLRKSEADFETRMLYLTCCTVVAIGLDTGGNAFFNKPLEWITQSMGTLNYTTNLKTYGAAISWNVSFQILQDNGNVITIPYILILLYRAIQYAVWFVIVWYINEKTLVKLVAKIKTQWYKHFVDTIDADMEEKIKAERHKREEEKQKKEVSEELYKRIKELKEKGETIRAIKVLRDGTEGTWTLQEAKECVDTMQDE